MVLQYAKEECVCVQELERKIIILNTLFQDTAAAVGLHQYAIDTIQATVDSATQDTSTAFVTLQVAEKQANSSRKVRERAREREHALALGSLSICTQRKCCIYSTCLICCIMLILLIAGIGVGIYMLYRYDLWPFNSTSDGGMTPSPPPPPAPAPPAPAPLAAVGGLFRRAL